MPKELRIQSVGVVAPLLPTELIAAVIEAPVVALLVHQVEHSLVNTPARKHLEALVDLFYMYIKGTGRCVQAADF